MKAKNWMWCRLKANGKPKEFTIAEGVKIMGGFCTRKGLRAWDGDLKIKLPGEKDIKVEFNLPRVPKPKKAKAKKVHVAKKATATQIRKTLQWPARY